MNFQPNSDTIAWNMHFRSSPTKVFDALTTDEGRAKYWAESTEENDGHVTFHIYNYPSFTGKILTKESPHLFELEYFGTRVRFELRSDGHKGTILRLYAKVNDHALRDEMTAGWVSVLMAMKAAVDFDVDLRNHDPDMAWAQGFADN
ncbi:MAG TPA: SRPBCC domain-containing protein [Candidatus Saccharimonadales bacterium]